MFKKFQGLFEENFKKLLSGQDNLFVTGLTKDELWETYLNSFSPNVRQEFNCNCCRQFIKNYGNIVFIKGNKLTTIWDFAQDDPEYVEVQKNMGKLVLSKPVTEVFVSESKKLGVEFNLNQLEDGTVKKWYHFYMELPQKFVSSSADSRESIRAKYRDAKNVFKRSLEEISKDSVDVVLELIAQKSLYRGEEFKGVLEAFLKCKKEYEKLPVEEKDNYCWTNSISNAGTVAKIRNTSIGTLLIDISGGMELDQAVSRFEKIMAPNNYKRPTPIISKRMVEEAEKTIEELGMRESLNRRFAHVDDVSVNNVFFVNRDKLKDGGDIFDSLKEDMPVNPRKLSKVEEISLEDFVEKVIPKAESVELLVEDKHVSNLFSLIAPENKEAPSLFKWDNGFSWSYYNAMSDSLKEKVKAAGGKVDGNLRISLEWFNYNDLDIHLVEPNGREIFFGNKTPDGPKGVHLDVDMNMNPTTRNPVENIIYPYGSNLPIGKYRLFVHNYTHRENLKPGFKVEVEFNGEIFTFNYDKDIPQQRKADVCEFTHTKERTLVFSNGAESNVTSKNVWGIDTNKFHKVSMGLTSPNYWDSNKVGNKHFFFVIDGAKNEDANVRGFFNEFLNQDLDKHKRVFETLAGKMNVPNNNDAKQLSGVGFSTTSKNSFICKVKGSFNRMLKVNV